MIKVVILLIFMEGFTMHINADEMYGITTMEECKEKISIVIKNFGADRGNCIMSQDTLPDTPKI